MVKKKKNEKEREFICVRETKGNSKISNCWILSG